MNAPAKSFNANRFAAGLHGKQKQREAAYVTERKRIEAVNQKKTDRLRALRLAKEAAERESAAIMAAAPKAKRIRTRKLPGPAIEE